MGDRTKVVLVVVLLAAAGAVFWFTREPAAIPESQLMVCVETGKRFHIARDRIIEYPFQNPETGRATLVPAYIEEDGKLKVSPRQLRVLKELGEVNRYVDLKTLEVRSS